jgi:EAL domain-containing protein (putative c-di-GMP-specific phosphodiesterase class I)
VYRLNPSTLLIRRASKPERSPIELDEQASPFDTFIVDRMPPREPSPEFSAAELEKALIDRELAIQYQPEVAIKSSESKIQGVEALVRWRHPRHGLLAPGQFLDAVQDIALMRRHTDFVMTEAVRQAGLWRLLGLSLEMTVNLGTQFMRDAAFPELMLNVTEAHPPEHHDLILDILTRLRTLGVGLALDNFGTRFWSLAEVYLLPFSEIKVDGSFLADALQERDARRILSTMTRLARTMHLTLCAEGVESWPMLDSAQRFGFDSAQGHFFSDAVDSDCIEGLVQSWPSYGPTSLDGWRAV